MDNEIRRRRRDKAGSDDSAMGRDYTTPDDADLETLRKFDDKVKSAKRG